MHQIDLNDANFKRLAEFADRIAKVLRTFETQPNHPVVAALDDLLGAIYALISAVENGFKGKSGTSQFDPAPTRAEQLAMGLVRDEGNWMAGFHFNNAMFRISAMLDRLPTALAGSHAQAANTYNAKQGKAWHNENAHKIRDEVNTVKHKGGLWAGRKADIATAMSALNELIDLAEALK